MGSIEAIHLTGDRDAWLEGRRDFIGASEMPIVCGVSSYGSLAELFAEKKGLRPPKPDNPIFQKGRWGEAAAFQALVDMRPEWKVVRASIHLVDRERRIACTPDGYAQAPDRPGVGLVQAKVVALSIFRQRWLDDYEDGVDGPATPPPSFQIQCQTELMLNPNCEWSVLAVLINSEFGWHFRLFDVERDGVIQDRIIIHAAEFIDQYLVPGIMPPFVPLRDEELIKHLYPKDDGTELDLTGDNRALAVTEDLVETREALRRMETRETELKMELAAKLGEHAYGRLADGRRIAWKWQHRKAHPVDASDFRVLRIQKAKRQ